jgi:hypothetical protein
MCLQAYRNCYPFGAGYDWESGTWPVAQMWEGLPEYEIWPYGLCGAMTTQKLVFVSNY